jgi:hypothetical protein
MIEITQSDFVAFVSLESNRGYPTDDPSVVADTLKKTGWFELPERQNADGYRVRRFVRPGKER